MDYTYGILEEIIYDSYSIGDLIEYNGMEFYVIKNSDSKESSVTMLKKDLFTIEELNLYGGVGTDNNYVNRYAKYDQNGGLPSSSTGHTSYYGSATCGFVDGMYYDSDCKTNYADSDIKHIVDAWSLDKFSVKDLVVDETGYSARLLTLDELRNNLGYGESNDATENTPNWLFNVQCYSYWTMTPYDDYDVWIINVAWGGIGKEWVHGYEFSTGGYYWSGAVRPVITIKKSALSE